MRIQEYCRAKEWEVVGTFLDTSVSAYTGVDRPGFDDLKAAVAKGDVDVVVAARLDRLSRSTMEALKLADFLRDHGCNLATVNGEVDTSSANGRAFFTITAALAELESAQLSERMREKSAHDARAGRYHRGGSRAFGRNRDGSVREEEAAALVNMANECAAGASLGSIARWLNASGHLTTTGRTWNGKAVSRALRNPHLRGLRQHQGDLYPGAFPRILDEGLALRVLERLEGNDPPPREGRAHLCSGRIFCGRCGAKMGYGSVKHPTNPEGPRFYRYQCRPTDGTENCGGLSASEHAVDEVVRDALIGYFRLASVTCDEDGGDEQTVAELRELVDADKKALFDLERDHYVERSVGAEDYRRLHIELQERIVESESEIERLGEVSATWVRPFDWLSRDPYLVWEEFSDTKRRDIVNGVVKRIVVRPAKHRGGNRFDPNRVEIEWLEPIEHEDTTWRDWAEGVFASPPDPSLVDDIKRAQRPE